MSVPIRYGGGSFVNNMIEYDAEYKKTPDILHMQKNVSV